MPAYDYNFLGLQLHDRFERAVAPGKSTIRFEFAYDGGGLGKGGTATLFVNGRKVAEGRIEHNASPMIFSADEAADVGVDRRHTGGRGVSGPKHPRRFTGRIPKVTIEVK